MVFNQMATHSFNDNGHQTILQPLKTVYIMSQDYNTVNPIHVVGNVLSFTMNCY